MLSFELCGSRACVSALIENLHGLQLHHRVQLEMQARCLPAPTCTQAALHMMRSIGRGGLRYVDGVHVYCHSLNN
jgi:hypothetical protein